jgi:hypothetical protein
LIEEIGRAASTVAESLKNQPVMIALVVLQALVLVVVLYNSLHRQTSVDRQFTQLFDLLQTCVKSNLPVR